MLHEAWIVGLMTAWLDFERMDRALCSLVDDLPDGEAMTDEEQTKALIDLDAEIDALERTEEALIVAAFERGVDILRRSSVSPQAVLGVKLPAPKPVVRRRAAAEVAGGVRRGGQSGGIGSSSRAASNAASGRDGGAGRARRCASCRDTAGRWRRPRPAAPRTASRDLCPFRRTGGGGGRFIAPRLRTRGGGSALL